MSDSTTIVIFALIVVAIFAIHIGIGVHNWLIILEYEREVEIYFEYADRASDAKTKADYFNQFIAAIEENELTEGPSSAWFQEQPNALLEENYKVAKSLQKRLNELALMDENSESYQYGMRQVTTQEFCWFPIQTFSDGYLLTNGGIQLLPTGTYDRCHNSD
jgi:hypothetical protein